MRRRSIVCLTGWLAAVAGGACIGAGHYRCSEADECRWDERRGTCEANGYCSYPDPDCLSGSRYSDLAGPYAGACVEVDGTSTSTSAPTTTGTSADTSSATSSDAGSSGTESTGAPDPLPGTPVWDPPARVHPGGPEQDAVFVGVDVRPDDTIVAVGSEEVVDEDALFVLFDGAGDPVWARQLDRGTATDRALDVTAAVGSEIYVLGSSPNPTIVEGWLAIVEPQDGDVESSTSTGQFASVDLAYMHPSTIVVVGYGQGVIGGRAFSDMLVPLWTAEEPIVPGDNMAAVAVDGVRDVAFAAAELADVAAIVHVLPGAADPLQSSWSGPEGSGVQALAWSGSDLVVGGYVGLGMRDVWVQRVAPDGTAGWAWTTATAGEEEVEAVAVDPTGAVVAVGFVTGLAQDARVWKLDPDGALVWEWTWADPIAADDVARAVAIWPEGDIAVAGGRTGEDGSTDAWVVRLTP